MYQEEVDKVKQELADLENKHRLELRGIEDRVTAEK
jgi:hypothetical protein